MANFANLAYGRVRTPPTPADSGTSLDLEPGQGDRCPTVPFTATIWSIAAMPDPTTAEVVTVYDRLVDTLYITRAQQGTTARVIVAGDQFANTITKGYLDVVPLKTDAVVDFEGSVSAGGQLTAEGLLVGLAGSHIFGATILDGPTTIVSGLAVTGGITATTDLVLGGSASIAGHLTVAGIIGGPHLRGYSEIAQTVVVSGGVIAFDYLPGNSVLVSLTENVTAITITNVPPFGHVSPVMLYYVASGGARSVAHTINGHPVRFANAIPPTMSTNAGYIDRVLYTCWDGGVVWLGDVIGLNY